jgi:hypothetical protein
MRADPSDLAVELLRATRSGDTTTSRTVMAELGTMAPDRLAAGLPNDAARLAFWIDVYNAAMQHQPSEDVRSWHRRSRLFRRPAITVAGRQLSLDAIEHGMLRGSRWKLTLGYGHNPRPSPFERAHQVSQLDPRIHFALNCGAASCPPIAAYAADQVDEQLDLATRSFLASDVIDADGVLRLPSVFLWFIGDFAGPAGTRRFLGRHGIDPSGSRIRYQRWDWTPAPGRWKEDD